MTDVSDANSPNDSNNSGASLRAMGNAHGKLVHARRVRKLVESLAPLLDEGSSVADVGCGDGSFGALLAQTQQLDIQGFEFLPRPNSPIPVTRFDGQSLPLADKSVDSVVIVDVLHHTDDPMVLLREAKRVSRRAVVIKDHRMSRPLAHATLRFMDWVGNRSHGVPLPYNYWPIERWRAAWQELDLTVARFETRLDIYPWPASWAFERGLHFVARLEV